MMMMLTTTTRALGLALAALLLPARGGAGAGACAAEELAFGTVCACNTSFCDEIALDWLERASRETAAVFTSNAGGLRLKPSETRAGRMLRAASDDDVIRIALLPPSQDVQEIIGFGGAFTDAAAFVMSTISNATRAKLIASYFSRDVGARYSLGRVPIGSSDFSRASYSLQDNATAPFALRDDRGLVGSDYKLDLIRDALAVIRNTTSTAAASAWASLKVFGSVWSAPPWWKTCARPPSPFGVNMCGETWVDRVLRRPPAPTYLLGGLNPAPASRDAYAKYIVDFLAAYADAGVELWGLTAQNEPLGNPLGNGWENTNYKPDDLASFIDNHLGPAVRAAFPRVKIMNGDDQYADLLDHARLANASSFIDGVAFHWYQSMSSLLEESSPLPANLAGGAANVGIAADRFGMRNRPLAPGFLLATEACNGYTDNQAQPGSWARGYAYLRDILHQINNGAAGWTDWNLALDMRGGPNHAGNFVDAPILVNAARDTFYKQPMYYALAHVSAFVPPGAMRARVVGVVDTTFLGDGRALEVAAFRVGKGADARCVVIVVNDQTRHSWPWRSASLETRAVEIEGAAGRVFALEIGPHEWKTVVYDCGDEKEVLSTS